MLGDEILQDQDRDAASQSTGHKGEAHEEDDAGGPGGSVAFKVGICGAESSFVYEVDDEHA